VTYAKSDSDYMLTFISCEHRVTCVPLLAPNPGDATGSRTIKFFWIFNFSRKVGRRLTVSSGDPRETFFLFQRMSVVIQRFNSALIRDSFNHDDNYPDL